MTKTLIEFHASDPAAFPAPYAAARGVPQWLKDMPMSQPLTKPGPAGPTTTPVPTVKQCPPFIEAMACGYVIPLAGDVTFTMERPGVLTYSALGKIVDTQHELQLKSTPFEGAIIVKFLSPWIIKTPPGYSTLFLPPLNQFAFPFQVLSGLVETDTYYRAVNFPTVCLMQPGTSITLRRGTPLAQAIPILRETWQSATVASDEAARDKTEREMAADRHNYYKNTHWKKKAYR